MRILLARYDEAGSPSTASAIAAPDDCQARMSTAMSEARSRLEAYISECVLGATALDLLVLRRLESDLIQATRHEQGLPF